MPPQRTVPPARPVKTERTHEENQERAYIAASRRSDRSLEARVESARRASEIHKRRTGRSLRVTEQDVVNEEMYEEEDDDLPMRFRGMAGHLQTSSIEFNRRLQAYLTNQVAMRSTNQLFAAQFPNVPQFAQNQQAMYQSSLMAQQYQQQLMMQQRQAQQQQQAQSPISPAMSYRQKPYPTPNMQQGNTQTTDYRSNATHGRSVSIATPQASANGSQSSLSPVVKTEGARSVSLASAPPAVASPQLAPTPQSNAMSSSKIEATQQPFQQFMHGPFTNNFLTAELPAESQMMLGSTFDPRDPMANMWMASGNFNMNSLYNYDAPQSSVTIGKGDSMSNAAYNGLNSTLAPSDLNLGLNDGLDYNPYAPTTSFFDAGLKESGYGSTSGTPGATGDFNLFIDQEQWEPTGSQ